MWGYLLTPADVRTSPSSQLQLPCRVVLPCCAMCSRVSRHAPGVSPVVAVIQPSLHLPLLLNLISDQQPKNWHFQQRGSCSHCIPAALTAQYTPVPPKPSPPAPLAFACPP